MEWISGNIFIRPNELPKIGDKVDGHKHNFDHTTIVFKGAVHVKTWERGEDCFCITSPIVTDQAPGVPDVPCRQCQGRGYLLKAGREGDFQAPGHFLVRADVEHEIAATEDNTVFWCVYSHREPQGRITLESHGWQEAYS